MTFLVVYLSTRGNLKLPYSIYIWIAFSLDLDLPN
jgi:hypothetical protein